MSAAGPVVLPWKTAGDAGLLNAEATPEFMLGSFGCLHKVFCVLVHSFYFGEIIDSVSGLSIIDQRNPGVLSMDIALQDLNLQ